MDRFGHRLKERRNYWEITQAELAKCVDVSTQVISNWERGYTQPNKDELYKLACNLNVSVDYLIGLTDDPLDFDYGKPFVDLLDLLNSKTPVSCGGYGFSDKDKRFIANLLTLVTEQLKERK